MRSICANNGINTRVHEQLYGITFLLLSVIISQAFWFPRIPIFSPPARNLPLPWLSHNQVAGRQSGKKQLSLVMSFLKHESIELRSFSSSEEKLGLPLLHFLRALGVFPFPLFKAKLESFSLILFCLLSSAQRNALDCFSVQTMGYISENGKLNHLKFSGTLNYGVLPVPNAAVYLLVVLQV